jgi:hypothetical protein
MAKFQISESVEINRPAETVFQYVNAISQAVGFCCKELQKNLGWQGEPKQQIFAHVAKPNSPATNWFCA